MFINFKIHLRSKPKPMSDWAKRGEDENTKT